MLVVSQSDGFYFLVIFYKVQLLAMSSSFSFKEKLVVLILGKPVSIGITISVIP